MEPSVDVLARRKGDDNALNRDNVDGQIPSGDALVERLILIDRLALIGEMASGFAHEVNQPLTAIATYARAASRMVASGAMLPEALTPILDAISEQALRAGESIARLRALTPATSSTRAPVDCNLAIREICDLLRSELARIGIALQLELLEDLPPVVADPLHIRQVLLNLLRNAIDALRDWDGERTIRIASSVNGRVEVVVTIWNAGAPISDDHAQRLFHPFFSTKVHGTGLGLNISRSLLRAHGGDLQHNRHSGPGTTFAFSLPKA